MRNKPTSELKQEYGYIKTLLEFHAKHELMKGEDLENYVNTALEILREIKEELEKRGESI